MSRIAAGGIEAIAFQALDGGRTRGISGGLETSAKGIFEDAANPSFYLLEDEDGNEVGWVHLAYVSNEGEGGLCVRFGSGEVVKLSKVDGVPGYLARRSRTVRARLAGAAFWLVLQLFYDCDGFSARFAEGFDDL